ncbi:Putative DNA-binding protein [Acidisarcina polymorpha]|uniref:DNA-binding protein n=2 Tax=Acidisarcina polymorpha TaxID=2211140 RepID=A0A2Z5G9Z0_9BACT|nr:Putative DNA-binding protein [Acidisarcina polymorpha]
MVKVHDATDQALGRFLQDRRAKLDPASFGFSSARRRTPGLRREEVAQRANISSAWYVCLEQGRGGAPSSDVLDKLARALLLTDAEREHLFVFGLGRAPESRYKRPDDIEPRVQRVLDQLSPAPAFIKTATWDVVAWNHAATVLWPNFAELALPERNTLRMVFLDPQAQTLYYDWEGVARMAVAAFRADVARAGAMAEVAAMVDELSRSSPAFKAMWQDNDVSATAHATKDLRHPVLGTLNFEASIFGVDGRQDLTMMIFMPTSTEVAERIRSHLEA